MKKFTNELKTGIVIVVAILVAIFFWVKTSNLTTKTYTIKTYFNRADGIKANSIVALAGIEVGRVENIKFLYEPGETKIEIVLILDQDAKVREDSIAYIGSSGFIGDAHIGITPGNSKTFIKENGVIISEDPIEMRKLMNQVEEISTNLDNILADVKTVVSDNKEKIDSIISNIEDTTENAKELSADIKAHPWKLLFKGKEKKKKKKKK